MARHSFIQMSKLSDVRGRINYITSPVRQENLYATYRTCDSRLWSDLARKNQEDFHRSGTAGKCIEARELIIALPEEFVHMQPQEVLRDFTEYFKNMYGVECLAALHHNKTKTNYHIHLIFAERFLLKEPVVKRASRNMFYNEQGKHVRTKKEILDETGELRTGCRVIHKGEVYERLMFGKKSAKFKSKGFLDEIKSSYTEMINNQLTSEYSKLSVYKKNSVFLPMKKIGKNNPKEKEIQENNRAVLRWNEQAARLTPRLSEEIVLEIKQKEILEPICNASTKNSQIGAAFAAIVRRATKTLFNFYKRWIGMDKPMRPEVGSEGFYWMLERQRAKSPYMNTKTTEHSR